MKKAIIVEDFELIASIWKSILTEEGFEQVEIIRHADDVEEKALALNPDIIFMDINLPGKKNGLELTESLMGQNETLKILVLTIHTEPSYIQRALNAGAKGYVTKNSSIAEIKTAVKDILSGKTYLCNEIRHLV